MTFSPIILGSGQAGYDYLKRTRDSQEQLMAQSGEIKRNLDAAKSRMASIQDTEALLADREVLQVALSAFGLEEDINNTGFLRQVLDSDLNNALSFANRLADSRYQDLALTFNFKGSTGANLPGAAIADTLAPQLQQLGSVDELFQPANASLLEQSLEAFGLQGDKDRIEFLKIVLQSDLDDPESLVNRLNDQKYIDFVSAFAGEEDLLPAALKDKVSDRVAGKLRQITSAEDLVKDASLLRSVLAQFGLEGSESNTYFLQSILESDLSDPNSLANKNNDTRYLDLAYAFNFQARQAEAGSIYGFAELAQSKPDSLKTADALLADTELLTTALNLFGLGQEAENTDFLKTILESDLSDNGSAANQQSDSRYRALAAAFDFGRKLTDPSREDATRVEKLISAVGDPAGAVADATEFFNDPSFFLAAMNFFDLPQGAEEIAYARRVLESDPTSATSSYTLASDQGYRLLHDALNFQPETSTHTYPPGFVDAVIDNYLEREFEVAVGNVDNSMRLALGFERSLQEIVDGNSSNDGRWFAVMGALPVRAVFEEGFGLPDAFGQLDIDQQLDVFKQRAQSILGTSEVGDFLKTDVFDEIQRLYLNNQSVAGGTGTGSANIASLLLANAV
jgi:hypothetical protein